MMFKNREDAGQKLGEFLKDKLPNKNLIILGLPRGGVVVAHQVAKKLGAPLDILCLRKVGAPFNPELALGAVGAEGGVYFFEDLIQRLHVSKDYLEKKKLEEIKEAKRRLALYRNGKKPLNLQGKTAVIVDDGLATGATMRVAILEAKKRGAEQVIMAIPVAPTDTFEELQQMTEKSYCLSFPPDFSAVGQFYADFSQTLDDEVISLLQDI